MDSKFSPLTGRSKVTRFTLFGEDAMSFRRIAASLCLSIVACKADGKLDRNTALQQIGQIAPFAEVKRSTDNGLPVNRVFEDFEGLHSAGPCTKTSFEGNETLAAAINLGWLEQSANANFCYLRVSSAGIAAGVPDPKTSQLVSLPLATRHLNDVTGISENASEGTAVVTYRWSWVPTLLGERIGFHKDGGEHTAIFRKFDSGWRIESNGYGI